jgi:pimeloyl-ACP methyl ester carboxylesterase
MTNAEDIHSIAASRIRPARALAALGFAAALAASGCVSLQSLEAMREQLPGRLVEVNGLEVHVEEWGSGPPLVLVHGFGSSTYSWRHIAPILAAEYRVVAVDLVGFGFSARPQAGARYSRAAQVRLLLDLADQLEIDRAHWVGHSYGGGLVTTLAYRAPERVRSLVLIDSTAPDWADRRRGLYGRKVFALPFVRLLALRPWFVRHSLERSIHDDALVDDELVTAYLDRVRVQGVIAAYMGLSRPQPALGEAWKVELEKISAPVLVLWGVEDRLIDIDAARRVVAALPDARLVPLTDSGHIPMEEQPQRVAEEMLRFLQTQEPAARHPAPPTPTHRHEVRPTSNADDPHHGSEFR